MIFSLEISISNVIQAERVRPGEGSHLILFSVDYEFWDQCDQIGRIFKFLATKVLSKRSQNDWQLFGLF